MSVTGTCPNCGCEKATYLNIDENKNVAIDCPPHSGCDMMAAVALQTALKNIHDEEYPITFS